MIPLFLLFLICVSAYSFFGWPERDLDRTRRDMWPKPHPIDPERVAIFNKWASNNFNRPNPFRHLIKI